jgi:hypothetical protein
MWTAGETTKLIDSGEVGWAKRSATCQLRLLGGSVLSDVCMSPDGDATALRVVVLAEEARVPKLMIRSGVHLDTPIVDAGFHGVLTIEMFNAGPSDVILRPGILGREGNPYCVGDDAPAGPYRHVFYGNEGRLGSKYASEFFSTPVTEGQSD